VIVLDEPTAGVDVELRQGLWSFVRRLNHDGHTIVLTTHYLEEAELLCGRIGMLKGGRLVALDSTPNLLKTFRGLQLKLRLDREELPLELASRVLARDGDRFTLELHDYAELEQVLVGLRQAGETILEFELQPPDLEEVFVRIMDRSA
jgi:ABC-2 type transport system ATP-binding protein